MSALETLLSRLTKVKGKRDSWTACCPAHEDKSPSLAVRQIDDGRILMHCFADCSIQSIMAAIGMDVGDLFPPDEKRQFYTDPMKPMKVSFYATDLMRIINFESTILQIAAFDVSEGKSLSDNDRKRVRLAHERITEAMRYGNV
jgi:hypothetical protein